MTRPAISVRDLVGAYSIGIFPMADEQGVIHWYAPDPRTIIPLDRFHASRTLRRICRQNRFEIAINCDFNAVIRACADRPEGTWISPEIMESYSRLHEAGFAHSVEARRDGALVGGVYGVAVGGLFAGESMFRRESNASSVALAALVARLRERGFSLFDVQFQTDHLKRFGAVEIPRTQYELQLAMAIQRPVQFSE
jgi:leucyl/phenylalanyl-tRNA--protein transferase